MSLERYSRATTSKNLKWVDYSVLDVDWLTAAGLVNDRLASALARLMATGEPGDYWDVVEALESIYKRGLTKDDTKAIKAAVWYFLSPACVICHGRGHPKEDDAPKLKEENCMGCHGTGQAPHGSNTTIYAQALMRLDGAAAMCFHAIARKVA